MTTKTDKEILLSHLRSSRKRYGKDHPKTYKAIYQLVKEYPLYEGYVEDWYNKHYYKL